jgi:hypothetical protein
MVKLVQTQVQLFSVVDAVVFIELLKSMYLHFRRFLLFLYLQGHPINARIKAKPAMNRFFSLPGAVNNGMPGVPPGMGIVPPSAVPLPVPVLLATAPGAPLPVAVAPVPPTAVPLVAAAGAASSLKNGYPNVAVVASGTPPPHEGAVAVVNPSSNPQQQQQPHMQPHHQQQPRFLYAAPPAPGSPYGAQPQLQLYAFHHPSSFYTPTVLQVKEISHTIFVIIVWLH